MDEEKGSSISRSVRFKDDDDLVQIQDDPSDQKDTQHLQNKITENGALATNDAFSPPHRDKEDVPSDGESCSPKNSPTSVAITPAASYEFWACKRCNYKNADVKGQLCAKCGANRLIRRQARAIPRNSLQLKDVKGEESLSPQAEEALSPLSLCDGSVESDDSSVEVNLHPPQILRSSYSFDEEDKTVVAGNISSSKRTKQVPDPLAKLGPHPTLNVTDRDDSEAPVQNPKENTSNHLIRHHDKRRLFCGFTAPRCILIFVTIFVLLCAAVVAIAVLLLADDNSSGSSPKAIGSPPATASPSAPPSTFPSAQSQMVPTVTPTVAPPPDTAQPTETPATLVPVNQPIRGPPRSGFGRAIDISGNGNVVAVGAYNARNADGVRGGLVQLFVVSPETKEWTQLGQQLFGGNPVGMFGSTVSLSLDGSTVAIGGPGYDTDSTRNAGYVKVFRLNAEDNEWIPLGPILYGESRDERLGSTITQSENGETIAVGSRKGIKIFTFDTESREWIQMGSEIDDGGRDDTGWKVSLSDTGLSLATGVPADDDSSSATARVYYFDDDISDWLLSGQIKGTSIEGSNDEFERPPSVSISGDGNIVAVHEVNSDGISLAGAFKYDSNDSRWSPIGQAIARNLQRRLVESVTVASQSVSLSKDGQVLAVNIAGVPSVFRYDSKADLWRKTIYNFLFFGNSVQLSEDGKIMAVGNEMVAQVDFFLLG